ncbi:hypothetical protein B1219_23460 [Pseudomonas ogarae]|nr:hypothetical protein B1219_23460 [Pseudomonas ogarae]OPG78391.1 hypothetical protein B1218_15780 [Pseudomonas ogarae]
MSVSPANTALSLPRHELEPWITKCQQMGYPNAQR